MEGCESSCGLPEKSSTGSAWRSKQSTVVLFTWGWLRDRRLIWKTIWTSLLKSFSVERRAKRERQLCEQSWWAENTFFLPTFLHFSFILPYAYWCGSLNILWHCLSLGLEWKLTFSSPVATAEFFIFAGVLSAALQQHHLLGFEIVQLEFYHLH